MEAGMSELEKMEKILFSMETQMISLKIFLLKFKKTEPMKLYARAEMQKEI